MSTLAAIGIFVIPLKITSGWSYRFFPTPGRLAIVSIPKKTFRLENFSLNIILHIFEIFDDKGTMCINLRV